MLGIVPKISDPRPQVVEFVEKCQPAPIVVFTGAGASKPLEFPVTDEFFKDLVEWGEHDRLQQRGQRFEEQAFALLRAVIASVFPDECKNKKLTFDVERVLQLLEWLRTNTSPNDPHFLQAHDALQAFVQHGGHGPRAPTVGEVAGIQRQRMSVMESLGVRELLMSLLDQLRDTVYDQYRDKGNLEQDALNLYKPLFDSLGSILRTHAGDTFSIPIFTTNYDRAIEEILESQRGRRNVAGAFGPKGVVLIDGFRPDADRAREHVWDRSHYLDAVQETKQPQIVVPYSKLHGSLGWRRRVADEWVIRTSVEERPRGGVDRDALIYPGEKSEPSQDPFATMHWMLKEFTKKAKVVVVIGFSLRDEHIYAVFEEALEQGVRFLFIGPPPSPTGVERLWRDQPQEKMVYYWPKAFGPDTPFNELPGIVEKELSLHL